MEQLRAHLQEKIRLLSEVKPEFGHSSSRVIVDIETLVLSADETSSSAAGEILSDIGEEGRWLANDAYCRWETELESEYADAIVGGSERSLRGYPLYARFETLLERELSLIPLREGGRALFIGSGPFPISAFHLLSQSPSCSIDCIDQDAEAVIASRQLVTALGLENDIRIFHSRGESWDVSQYDLVLIALLAKPKEKILNNLLQNAKPECHLLCRTSLGLRTLLYEPAEPRDLAGFQAVDRQIAGPDQTISTLLLQRKAVAESGPSLRWLPCLDDATQSGILSLIDSVATTDTTHGFATTLETEAGLEWMQQLDFDVRSQRVYVWIAQKGDRIIAQLHLAPSQLPNCTHIAWISQAMIDPAERGGNVLKRGLVELLEKCSELGVEMLYIDVRADTRPADLWKALGFRVFGVAPDYARVGDERHEGLYMYATVDRLTTFMRARGRERKAKCGRDSSSDIHIQPAVAGSHTGGSEKMLAGKEEFVAELQAALDSHVTLDHPIVLELMKPEKNWELLRALALQGYQLTKNFLSYVERLYFYCPLETFKQRLLVNLWEESTGRLSRTKNHVLLVQDFIRAIGISDEERDAAIPTPATAELIEYRAKALDAPETYYIGAAAVMIASEGQNLETRAGEGRDSMLGKVYGLTEKDLLFFSVHQKEDVGHVKEGLTLVSSICSTRQMQVEAIDAVHHTCDLFYRMYDSVLEQYNGMRRP